MRVRELMRRVARFFGMATPSPMVAAVSVGGSVRGPFRGGSGISVEALLRRDGGRGAALILSRVCEGREAGSPLREAVTLEAAYQLGALVREEGLVW